MIFRGLTVLIIATSLCMPVVDILANEELKKPSQTSDTSGMLGSALSRGSLRTVLQPVQDIRLSSRAAGIVEQLAAQEGQSVKAGDAILVLDSSQERAEVSQAEAMVRGAEAELEHAKRDLDRITPLSEEQIYSNKQLSDAQYSFKVAQSRLQQTQAALTLAKVRLANRTITAPIDGIFLKKNKNVGEAVERFETVARIVDISALEAVVYCDSSLFEAMREARDVRIQITKSEGNFVVVTGTVTSIDPIIDPATGTFRVRVQIPVTTDTAPGYPGILLIQPRTKADLPKP